jgi:hypothetical protein
LHWQWAKAKVSGVRTSITGGIELKESSTIIKPPVKTGPHKSITWAAEDDSTIVRMIMSSSSYPEIASAMGMGLKVQDISNR